MRQAQGGTLQFTQETVESDGQGRAVFTATGLASGYDVLTFSAGIVSTEMNTRVKPLGTESPKKPTANLTDGDTVPPGTQLVLTCDTEDAVIYYTTDNTCPCTDSPDRQIYTGPISLTETTLFRIASYTEAGGYGERLNLRVSVAGDCLHSLTHTPAQTPTCSEPGCLEHWHCALCGKDFTGEDAAQELTQPDLPPLVTVTRMDEGVRLVGLPENVTAIAAAYDAQGRMLQAAVLERDGEAAWGETPAEVRVFYVDSLWRAVCPCYTAD